MCKGTKRPENSRLEKEQSWEKDNYSNLPVKLFSDESEIKELLEKWNKVEIVQKGHITGWNKVLDKIFLKGVKFWTGDLRRAGDVWIDVVEALREQLAFWA